MTKTYEVFTVDGSEIIQCDNLLEAAEMINCAKHGIVAIIEHERGKEFLNNK